MNLVGHVTRQVAIRQSCSVLLIWLCCAADRSSAQQTADLQQQIQQLKQEYQQKIEELDRRLAAMEANHDNRAGGELFPEGQRFTRCNLCYGRRGAPRPQKRHIGRGSPDSSGAVAKRAHLRFITRGANGDQATAS